MDVAAAQLFGADMQRGERALHRRIGQFARGGQAFAQTNHAAEGIDHREVLARRPRDQQAAIVRAQIERGVGLASGAAFLADMTNRCVERAAGIAGFSVGPGGALVAEIGYLAGRLTPLLASRCTQVRRRLVRHGKSFCFLPRSEKAGAGT